MLTRKNCLMGIMTLVVALCGLSASALLGSKLYERHPHRTLASATWNEVYQSVEELVDQVDAIVLATAVATSPGRIAYSANGEDALPFEVVEFSVVQGLKGIATGDSVYVERVGGVDPQGESVRVDMDGGEFTSGQTYLLFLKHQKDGPYYAQVNDQGRFHVLRGRLRAVDPHDKVAAAFHGRAVAEGIALVRERAGRR